jgi:hypothetical protein
MKGWAMFVNESNHGILLSCVLLTACLGTGAARCEVMEINVDVCVIGGGSGGIGAAVTSSRAGADVVLVERENRLGGTSTNAYVSNWEPGPGNRIAREIYDRLSQIPNAVGITKEHNPGHKKGPFGLWLITPGASYEQTLRRAGVERRNWHAVVFDPDAFHQVVTEMLEETAQCRIMLDTTFTDASVDGNRMLSIEAVDSGGAQYRIKAKVFIDSTGGVHLCRKLGCKTMLGSESASRFNEASAPEKPHGTLNAISLCYRIRKSEDRNRGVASQPAAEDRPRAAHIHSLPNGDLIVNPMAMLPGESLIDTGYEEAYAACKPIVQAHWQWLQTYPALAGYQFHSYAPMLGIRESYRVVGEYVLTQHDVEAGLAKQTHPDIIAIADHALDVHGRGGERVHGELEGPYGIPYRCLIPKGWDNLLVACRGASFSHVAASSCRLSRTMISIGSAAGLAAATAAKENSPVSDIDVSALQEALSLRLPDDDSRR